MYEVTEVQHLQGHCATLDLAAEYPKLERNVDACRNIQRICGELSALWLASGGLMSGSYFADGSAANEGEQEARNIRRLQVMISMVMSVISQDPNLTIEEASELAAGAKKAALAMFPDKELAFDILYKPRLQRLMNERFRLQ